MVKVGYLWKSYLKKKKDLVLLVFQEYGRNFLYFDCKSSSNPVIEVTDDQQNLQ